MNSSFYYKITQITLIWVFLVIIAGSVVRMTGSGMGCPDWPKCFGYYIPPTDVNQIKWEPNHDYDKGVMIIKNDSLWSANEKFKSTDFFSKNNWTHYTKHNYAHFNPSHTWTEYVNRWVGVIAGLFVFFMTILSFKYYKIDKWLLLLCIIQLVLFGFQAWLGKVVVDSNLNPLKITAHMFGALAIIMIQLIIINRSYFLRNNTYNNSLDSNSLNLSNKKNQKYLPQLNLMLLLFLFFLLVQVFLGTQVRQQIDDIAKTAIARDTWVEKLDSIFLIHRSFSTLLLIFSIFILRRMKKNDVYRKHGNTMIICILLTILAGVILNYFNMMAIAQPIHLLLACILISIVFDIFLKNHYLKTYARK